VNYGNGVPVAINAADEALVLSCCSTKCEHKCKANISCIIALAVRSSGRMLECDRFG
jgi:hypothetical protein